MSLARLALVMLVALAALHQIASADLPDFKKMRVRELQALLDERGIDSKGYSEKSELVKRVEETYHMPLAAPKDVKSKGKASGAAGGRGDQRSDADIEKIMRDMENLGMGNFKMFKAEDFQGMNSEEMSEKMRGVDAEL